MVFKLQLVKNEPDLATIAALERLLAMARAGELIALAYVALEPGRGYSADVLGCINNHRLLALGVCHELVDLIGK